MLFKIFVATDSRRRYLPIRRCPFGVHINFGVVGVVQVKVFPREKYLTVEVMVEPAEGFLCTTGRKAESGAEFVA